MDYIDYDLALTDEQCQIRDLAHRFAAEVLRPTGIAVDRLDSLAAIAADSPLHKVYQEADRLGFTRLGVPVELGGMGASPTTQHLVLEELAWGNAGLAGMILMSSYPAQVAAASGQKDLIDEFAIPYLAQNGRKMIGCWSITEPDHGSDELAVVRPELRLPAKGQLTAHAEGDSWILRGQKSAWVSNGPIATHAIVHAQMEPRTSFDRGGIFLVPLDLPGASRGRPLDKHGLRGMPQGELYFDDVKLPRHYMVVGPSGYVSWLESTLTAFNPAVACLAVGVARAAYECALGYAKERIQGGRPLVEHQSVRQRLFRMFSLLQAARSFSRHVYVYNLTRLSTGQPAALEHSIATKVFCSTAAVEVATLALQLHGGNGLTKEYPLEMFLRDALSFTIADGENAFLEQVGASLL